MFFSFSTSWCIPISDELIKKNQTRIEKYLVFSSVAWHSDLTISRGRKDRPTSVWAASIQRWPPRQWTCVAVLLRQLALVASHRFVCSILEILWYYRLLWHQGEMVSHTPMKKNKRMQQQKHQKKEQKKQLQQQLQQKRRKRKQSLKGKEHLEYLE